VALLLPLEEIHDRHRTQQNFDERLVFTVSEAGELLGISRAFAYELVGRGELPVIRLGRRCLVPKVAVLALDGQDPHGERSPPLR
jgi:excisionase family DNA binding protein